jgi:hypothetical protein
VREHVPLQVVQVHRLGTLVRYHVAALGHLAGNAAWRSWASTGSLPKGRCTYCRAGKRLALEPTAASQQETDASYDTSVTNPLSHYSTTNRRRVSREIPAAGVGCQHQAGEHVDRQGQQAMDQAVAMPVVRLFFGLMAAIFSVTIVVALTKRDSLTAVALVLCGIPIVIDFASVSLFGRSRTPWFRAIMRTWRT